MYTRHYTFKGIQSQGNQVIDMMSYRRMLLMQRSSLFPDLA